MIDFFGNVIETEMYSNELELEVADNLILSMIVTEGSNAVS